MKTRTNEHQKNIKLKPKYHNVISKHKEKYKIDNNYTHEFLWEKVKILHKEKNFFKRSFAEMVFIKNEKNALNANTDCDKLANSYQAILKKLIPSV